MKTNKTFTRTISCILSTAITMQVGWALTNTAVNADGTITILPSEIGSIVQLSSDDSSDFRIITLDSGYTIQGPGNYQTVSKIGRIEISGPLNLTISADLKTEIEMGAAAARVTIDEGCTFECEELYAEGGTFYNYGTMKFDVFMTHDILSDDSSFSFINEGTIEADTIYLSDIQGFISSPLATYKAKDSFTVGYGSLNGTVEAERSTSIHSDGGSFTLKVDGATTTIDGETDASAYELFDDPNVTISGIPVIYYGQEYDISDYVSVADGYDKSLVTFEYSSNGGLSVMDDKPSYPINGNYYVRAVAPSYGSYLESGSGWTSYKLQFIPIDELYNEVVEGFEDGDPYVTVTGVTVAENENKYVKEGLTLTVPEGIMIKFPTASREALNEPANSVTLTHDDLFLEGYTTINQDFEIEFVDANSGATTQAKSILDVVDGIEDFIFDVDTPSLSVSKINGDVYSEPIEITDDAAFVAEQLSFSVYDDNLATVTTDINGTVTDRRVSEGVSNFVLSSVANDPQVIKVTATDEVGRETVITVTLYRSKVTPSLTVTLPDPLYVGDEYEPEIETESDGEISIVYHYTDGRNTVLLTPPTAAGTYEIQVSVEATDVFNAASYQGNFDIVKRPMTPTVTVENTYVGESYEPELNSVPEDYEGDITFEFKLSTDPDTSYSEEFPEAAGTYTVKATLAATGYYSETTCTSTFTIYKREYLGSISASDIYVGDPINVSIYNTLTERDDLIFEYKLVTEPDSAFSTVEPQAAGTYRVRVTAPENYYFETTTFTKDFTISKRPVTATVTVDDLVAGDDIVPVINTDPEGYDGTEITYEYKRSDVADAVFSTTVPATAGNYIVQATLPETDTYLGTTCTSTFTINRSEFSPSVSVADIFVGGTPNPVMSYVPEDYDGTITYTYKLSTAETYSATVPTAAGTYDVKATLPATDKYLGTSCEVSFTINKKTAAVTVTVNDVFYGDEITPVVSTVSDGKADAAFMYKLEDEPDSAFSSVVPTDVGTYTIKVTVPETDTYQETSSESTFNINKIVPTITVNVDDFYVDEDMILGYDVGDKPHAFLSQDYFYFEIKPADAPDTEYTEFVLEEHPTAAGTYVIRLTVLPNNLVESGVATDTFTIKKHSCTVEVTAEDTSIGVVPYMEITTLSDGKDSAIIEYKADGDPDSAYTTEIPSTTGKYILRVTIPETEKYLSCSSTCEINFVSPPRIVISVEDIYYGDTPDPVVTNNYMYSIVEQTIEYKLVSEPDSAYSETVPTAVGKYDVRIWVAYPRYIVEATGYDTFEIKKLPVEASVTVPETLVDAPIEPEIKVETINYGDHIDDAVIEYKPESAPDSAYSTTAPTAAGTYTIRVTLPSTDIYEGPVCEAVFTISKIQPNSTVSVLSVTYVDDTPNYFITSNSDGKDSAVIEYKAADAENTAYSTTVPDTAGEYVIRVTIPETDKYLSSTCTTTFSIIKYSGFVGINVPDIYVGEIPHPELSTYADNEDEAIYEYREYSAPNESFSETVPTEAGLYVLRVTIPESRKYESASAECEFTIMRNSVGATVSVADITYGETPNPVVTSDSPAKDEATFEYKPSDEPDSAYSATVPAAVGTYTVKATIPLTPMYSGTTCYATFKIEKAAVTASVTVADITYGETPAPVLTTNSDGKDSAVFLYRSADDPDSVFLPDVPTAAGRYYISVQIPATASYLDGTCESSFEIKKLRYEASIQTEDVDVGMPLKVDVIVDRTIYDGYDSIVYEYKYFNEPDTQYTTREPFAAGTYYVRATLPETETCYASVLTGSFNIGKKSSTVAVSVEDIFVGETPNPTITTVSDGKDSVTFQYKISTQPDSTYSTTVPTEAGTYSVLAIVPETDTYIATSGIGIFTIKYRSLNATVTVEDSYVGENYDVSFSLADTTYFLPQEAYYFEFKPAGAPDTDYTETRPAAAGTYVARLTVLPNSYYEAGTATGTFTIRKNPATASVTVADIFVGGKVDPVVTTISDGTAVFEYKLSTEDAYSSTVPTAAGEYTVKATIPETAKYLGTTCTGTFRISLNKVTVMKLTVDDIYVGQTVSPSFKTDSDGSVTIEYKPSAAPDSSYSTVAPTAKGTYTARAIVSETAVYEGAVCSTEFTISYLDAPDNSYNPTGTSGNNGYFTSDVVFDAPEGYLISDTAGGNYSASIPYTEDLESVYLKRIEDGALTSAINITNKPKIDKVAPTITASSGSLVTGSIVYISNINITVTDPNLKSLTINGEPVDLNAPAGNVITLSPGYGVKSFIIVAEDIAGNKTTIEFTLKSEWLQNKIILPDVVLPLETTEFYKLDDGQWIVTKGTDDAAVRDTTVYSGNMPVYVNEDDDYTFTKVS